MSAKKPSPANEFIAIDAQAPATLASVVAAVMQLSTLAETEILELVSEGRLAEVFPFRPGGDQRPPADFVAESDLIEASPRPLKRRQRQELIQASVAVQAKELRRRGPPAGARAPAITRVSDGTRASVGARPAAKSVRSRSSNTRLRASPQR